ncbi:hypothetical protein D9757_003417 [Collybiopsis confluens]|uniref:ASST-domain-containing protein n=1 Tax=Collybiopsis confluens TaxID=2823264 RepID=A0A8H5HTJ0_9AGAR|nr:hypothetical protein D9757_003417 [Collybiopsis confluens]
MQLWQLPFTLSLLTFPWRTLADTSFSQSSDYSSGALGGGPIQTFKSSSSTPAAWNFVVPYNDSTAGQIDPGFIFMAPRGTDVKSPGALIYDKNGDLIWDGTQYGQTLLFRTATYQKDPVILLWTGAIAAYGVGSGYDLILNNKYQIVANFTADLNGTLADFHDTVITSNDTALITAYQPKTWDLSNYNIPNGWLLDSVAQEVDPSTGKASFTWIASDHVDVNSCYASPGSSGTSEDNPWDFFHINSIDKDSAGNYLISSRHCHTLYYVGPNGNVIWTIGGKNSSVTMNANTGFGWQHDARWRNNEKQISIFDNAGTSWEQDSTTSRGILLDYDAAGNSVSLSTVWLPFNQTVSESQGNVGMMDSGNTIIGWGQEPYFSEYNADGQFLYAVQFGVGDVQSYRAYSFNWTGNPTTLPSVSVETDDSSTTVYASWNGATEVVTWRLLGSTADSPQLAIPISNHSRSGFETGMTVTDTNISFTYYQVAAFNSNKKITAYSKFVASDGSSHDPAANQTIDSSSSSGSGSSSSGTLKNAIPGGLVVPVALAVLILSVH